MSKLQSKLFEFFEEVERHQDPAALGDAFQGFTSSFGMDYYMIGDPRPPIGPPRDRVWATTWPMEWLVRFGERNYVGVDPVLRRVRTSNRVVRWRSSDAAPDRDGARVLEEAGEFGMKAGLAFPLGHGAAPVIVSLGGAKCDIGKSEEYCLRMGASFLHGRLDQLRSEIAAQARPVKLAPRERECLAWVAAGKTDWEISQILMIAEQTVHEYVQNALTKLNATTRAQAVAIAIKTNQIIL